MKVKDALSAKVMSDPVPVIILVAPPVSLVTVMLPPDAFTTMSSVLNAPSVFAIVDRDELDVVIL